MNVSGHPSRRSGIDISVELQVLPGGYRVDRNLFSRNGRVFRPELVGPAFARPLRRRPRGIGFHQTRLDLGRCDDGF